MDDGVELGWTLAEWIIKYNGFFFQKVDSILRSAPTKESLPCHHRPTFESTMVIRVGSAIGPPSCQVPIPLTRPCGALGYAPSLSLGGGRSGSRSERETRGGPGPGPGWWAGEGGGREAGEREARGGGGHWGSGMKLGRERLEGGGAHALRFCTRTSSAVRSTHSSPGREPGPPQG